MKKYEYKVIKTTQEGFWDPKVNDVDLTSKLNGIGQEGWELVSAVETNSYQGITKEIVLFFKEKQLFKPYFNKKNDSSRISREN